MDLLSHSVVYALLFAFGAFSVAVHAYSQYGTPLEFDANLQQSRQLENIALPYLGGPRAYNSGFLCYLAIIEFLYIVLSSSSVILELSLSVVGVEQTVGALTLDQSNLNPLTPVAASSVIMTIGHVKPFTQIENAIRRIAHHVAGIPNGVYETLRRVHDFRFLDDDVKSAPRLNHASASALPSISRSVEAARQRAWKVEARAREAGMDALDARHLAENVVRSYALESWTIGADGERVWSGRSLQALTSLLQRLRPAFELFDGKLKHRLRRKPAADLTEELEAWVDIAQDARVCRNELSLLFALLSINQPDAVIPPEATQIRRLMQHVQRRDESREINFLLGAVILGLGIGLFASALYYALEQPLVDWLAVRLGLIDSQPLMSDGAASGLWTVLRDQLVNSIDRAVDSVMPFGLIFLTAALVALSIRASRASSRLWTHWDEDNLPVRQYLSAAVLSTVIAFLLYTLYSFYVMVLAPSMSMTSMLVSPSLLKDFSVQFAGYLLIPLIALPSAVAVCFIVDAHSSDPDLDTYPSLADDAPHSRIRERLRWSWLFVLVAGLINLLVRLQGGTIESLSEAVEALIVPGLLLGPCVLVFATLVNRFGVRKRKRAAIAKPARAESSVHEPGGERASVDERADEHAPGDPVIPEHGTIAAPVQRDARHERRDSVKPSEAANVE